jgi:heat shock protein HtpX
MATTVTALDADREAAHQRHNLLQTWALTAAMTAVLMVSAWSFFSWTGAAIALGFTLTVRMIAPAVAPDMVMRLFRAQAIDPRGGAQLYRIRDVLVQRAGLAVPPDLYVVPSLALNAFSVGSPARSAIAVTEGLLRKLDERELVAVMAHELAHIKNHDLATLGFADVMTRVLQVMSWVALIVFFWHLPSIVFGDFRVPWLGMVLLYLGPTLSSLLQLALSRTREFDADLDSLSYTGDPEALASALTKIEHQTGKMLDELVPPGARRATVPSLLRSHPHTHERIGKLKDVAASRHAPVFRHGEPPEPMVTLAGVGPASMRPRLRLPGIWI